MLIAGCDSNGDETSDLPTTPDTIITFDDAKLKEAVHEELEIPRDQEITSEDLKDLTVLDVPGWGVPKVVKDLSGLEYCSNLEELDLSGNSIVDISPLASLTNLQRLGLVGNEIADISPLASLTNLQNLVLTRNSITDISPLASLTNLQGLVLAVNSITDISPLASLTNLDALGLTNNSIADISPLASLTNLKELSLDNNSIVDISPLASLTKLQGLDLGSNSIVDISPLMANSGLSEGDTIYISDNPLSDTSLNEYIPQLEGRGVEVNPVKQRVCETRMVNHYSQWLASERAIDNYHKLYKNT